MGYPTNYIEQIEYLSNQFEEVDGCSFYAELFPDNERSGELNTDFSSPNAIYLYTDERDKDSKRRMRRRIMLKDTWEQDYMNFVEQNEKTLCGGLAYRARSNKLQNAQRCHAIIIDLDGVGLKELRNLFLRFTVDRSNPYAAPMPTFIVSSGTGVHLYYVLDEPIDLFPNIKIQLKGLKHDLTFKVWDYKSTSQIKSVQYQSINQGFRMVGSINSKYGTQVRAFRTGERVSIEYLNRHVKSKVDLEKRFKPSKMTKEQAKIKFPEWYAKTFDEDGNRLRSREQSGKWDIKGKVHGEDPFALYHWWMRQAPSAVGGHRYFFLMCMSIYASKCDVPKAKLRKDMQTVFEELKTIAHENPLTKEDIDSALEAYSREYWNFNIDTISQLSAIRIEKNKRNGRRQKDHIKLMNFVRDEINGNKDWQNKDGRPKKSEIVEEWRKAHPEGKKIDCERETGLSRHTVLKWWDGQQ